MHPIWSNPHPQPSSKIITFAASSRKSQTLEKPKACERQVPCDDDTAAQLRPRFSLAVFSCHSKAAGLKRNWDSSSASYASRPWQFVVLCTKMAQLANFPMTSKSSPTSQSGMNRLSMLDCSCFLFVNYILRIQNQSNLETRCMFLDRRETGRGSAQPPCGLPLRAPCVLISPESG
jgi:hypothetical protein